MALDRDLTPDALVTFALDAWHASPAVRIEDAYKWLFQATRGAEHAVQDVGAARDRLLREWDRLADGGDPDRHPIEHLRPDGAIVRVHLAPLKARGVDAVAVTQAFLDSARAHTADVGSFARVWDALRLRLRVAPAGEVTLGAWERLDAATRRAGFPPVHHSDTYRAACAPAYRVMTATAARRLLA
jgi:hypothetical protein